MYRQNYCQGRAKSHGLNAGGYGHNGYNTGGLNSQNLSKTVPEKYKLTYFGFRGRGELPRLIFAAAGVPYIDDRISFEQWGAMKTMTPFGGVCFFKTDISQIKSSFSETKNFN
jgi:hypothetical protein